MIKNILNEFRISIIATVSMAVLLCGLYPLAVWLIAQGIFPEKANGSLISMKDQVVGSSLLAQRFDGPEYFHPRPSAAGAGYDAAGSGGSNLGPTSMKLINQVKDRVAAYRNENNLAAGASIPADAVTTSASGLDPHITIENALLQAGRVARARNLPEEAVRNMIALHTEARDLGFLGQPRVNVLMLNMDFDNKYGK
jgi:potassium-transporting ATPase KdpC subunit